MERGRFYQQFGERSGSGQQERLPSLPFGGMPPSGEQRRVPIDVEARLAEMDRTWGTPREIGTSINDAANIMDDRLNSLHQEVLATGDQASIQTMNVLYEALKVSREQYPHAKRYVMTERERRIVSACSERMGNGAWYDFAIQPEGAEEMPIPSLADVWDYDFADTE